MGAPEVCGGTHNFVAGQKKKKGNIESNKIISHIAFKSKFCNNKDNQKKGDMNR